MLVFYTILVHTLIAVDYTGRVLVGTITECYSSGPVSWIQNGGGLVGENSNGPVTLSFWCTETTGQSTSAGGTGITTDQLLQSATFIEAGWDYAGIWTQVDGQTLPYFSDATIPGTYYNFSVSAEGNGTVSCSGGNYPAWSLVDLTVEAGSGYTFAGWLGDGPFSFSPLSLTHFPVFLYGDITMNALFLEDIPIHIYTIEDLQNIGNSPYYPLSWDYLIENDIDASSTATWNNGAGTGFSPIGSPGYPFTGSINGQGHVISGLNINRQMDYVGLVGYMTETGRLENIGLTSVSILGGALKIGGLIGENFGTVTKCYIIGKISGSYFPDGVGGLIGSNEGTVSKCYAMGEVLQSKELCSYNLGGLIGSNKGMVVQCFATGPVSGGEHIGGLIGENEGSVTKCYATGALSGQDTGFFDVSEEVGGLIGLNKGTVTQCYATGTVLIPKSPYLVNYSIGGLMGANSGPVTQCYATGPVSGNDHIGGMIGRNSGRVNQCYATGVVSGDKNTGGLIGGNGGQVYQCYATGAVSGEWASGGLIGYLSEDMVTQCYATGVVSWYEDVTGGLIGISDTGQVFDSYWDTETSGHTNSAGGTGKTTMEMMQQVTFVNWDFEGVWNIVENTTYPFFLNMPGTVLFSVHSADTSGDGWISLSELIRMIQLHNSDGYHCEAGTEDGYSPGQGDESCAVHDSDYNPQDWQIGLTELLRVIQFYNGGGYHVCPEAGTEDGYCLDQETISDYRQLLASLNE